MLHRYLLTPLAAALLLAAPHLAPAQTTGSVGIGTTAPDASAALDIVSSSKGLLLPRVAAATGIASPAPGLLVYQTGSPAGFYYNAGDAAAPSWQQLATTGSGSGDNLGNHTATQPLNLQDQALTGTGASISGIGVGVRADGGLNLGQNTVGNNVLLGFQAGQATTGRFNQFSGYRSGYSNTSGQENLFVGYNSGYANTTGGSNQFVGFRSGEANTTGYNNHFDGYLSGYSNTTGHSNHFVGNESGGSNTTGKENVFVGFVSGGSNTTGNYNLFLGNGSGFRNTTGNYNLFLGYMSGDRSEAGTGNTVVGSYSGPSYAARDITNATALGAFVTLTNSNTVVLGNDASVGIGTSNPTQKLEVAGTVYSTTGGFKFPDGTTQATAASTANLTGDITSTGSATTYTNVVPATKGGAGTVSGLLRADGNGLVSAATAGTDYLTPAGAATGFIQNQAATAQAASFHVAGTGTVGGLLTAGSATVAGNVGIGTTTAQPATQKLDVRGNLRLGNDGGNSATGTGQAIEWVGPGVNTDPVGLYRVNPASDQSELRVVVGDGADANDKFVVGRMNGTSSEGGIPAGSFTPTFSVNAAGQVQAPGLAGTGTRVLGADANGTLTTTSVPGDNLGNHTATQALNLGTNALVGNGGTTGLAVDAAGNAQLPAANAYTYAAPKTYTITYAAADFQPETVRSSSGTYVGDQKNYRYPGGGITSQNVETVNVSTARVPLHLPQGAVLVSAVAVYYNATAFTGGLTGWVVTTPAAGTPISPPLTAELINGMPLPPTPTMVYQEAVLNLLGTVINNNKAYYLRLTGGVEYATITLTYTVSRAE